MIGAALLSVVACGAKREAASANAAAPVAATQLTAEQLRSDAALAPRIAALLDAPGNFDPALSPDGKTVLFRSDRGGTAALYVAEVAQPTAAPKLLLSSPERIMSPIFARDGHSVFFRQDHGADENYHIFRASLDGAPPVDLTPGVERWRDTPLLPRDQASVMLYSARKPTDYTSMLFAHDLTSGQERLVFRDELPGTALDVSPDGARALWVHEAPAGGHELFEIDVSSGVARKLSPLNGQPARISCAAYSADAAVAFIATDAGSERHVLVALDLKSLTKRAEYEQREPASAEVGAVVPSPTGDRVAVQIDAGNHGTVRVLDAHTLAVLADVPTPLGGAGLGIDSDVLFSLNASTFSSDGSHFLLALSAPDHNSNIYSVDSQTGTIEALRRDGVPSEVGSNLAASIVTVKAFDGLSIPVNVYLPKGANPGAKLPTIISFHGGPNASTAFDWDPWSQVFVSFGFAVLQPNIRGSTGFGRAYELADDGDKRVDALKDMASVNEWARRQAWCDPDRLVLQGGSYGGYLVLMGLTRQPALWRAGVDLAGISDLEVLMASGSAVARYYTEFGDPKTDAKRLKAFSPIHDVDKIAAPLLVYQGENDSRVPRAHADAIVRALRKRNVPVEYMVATDEGHTLAHRENAVEFLARMLRFLRETGVLTN